MTVLQPGDTIDIWVVEAALGSGGMGSVYRCHNRTATRILAAIKVLEGGLKRYPEAEARFIREAEILYQLDHPNIVKVRNIRTDADPPYLEMEFVAGESFDERMRRGPLTYHESVQSMRQVADALAYLHAKHIRHRDIKPANLLLQKDGRTKLVDFGLAVEADTTRITQQGMAFGTVSYAPPEWITPDQLDPTKWDIYALGVVFYELLTGNLAFPVSGHGTARQQAMQVIVAKQDHPPLDPGDAFHDDVRALVADMTAADANRRIGDAAEVLERMNGLSAAPKRVAGVTLAPTPGQSLLFAGDTGPTDTQPPPTPPPPIVPPAAPARRAYSAATTPLTMPVPARIGRVVLAFGGVGAVAIGGLLVAGVGVAVSAWWLFGPPPMRELVLEMPGLPAGAPVDLVSPLGVPVRDGDRYTFAAVAPGPVDLEWAVGAGCTVAGCGAPGGCASWCAVGETRLDVTEGAGPLVLPVPVALPAPRDVSLALSGLPPDLPAVARLVGDGGSAPIRGASTAPGNLVFSGVPPGAYRVELTVGACAPEASGCGASCPPGCRSVVEPVVVPVTGDPVPATLAVVPPVAIVAPAAPVRSSEPPRTGIVTIKKLAAWLERHPDWTPGGQFAPADRYLSWWSTGDRTSHAPATQFTPRLAQTYCVAQGARVPPVDAEPRQPPDGKFELRLAERKFVMLEVDDQGQVRSFPVEPNTPVVSIAVFRCVK